MKKTFVPCFACFAIVLLIGVATMNANEAIAKKILQLHPQADTSGDGVPSDAEEAAISRMALKRYPGAKPEYESLVDFF